jgi:hypothetical protein
LYCNTTVGEIHLLDNTVRPWKLRRSKGQRRRLGINREKKTAWRGDTARQTMRR